MYIYIYIYRERERERERQIDIGTATPRHPTPRLCNKYKNSYNNIRNKKHQMIKKM